MLFSIQLRVARKLALVLIFVLGMHFFGYGKDKMNMKNYVNDGFSWVIDKKLGGMPFPGVFEIIENDILFLKSKGITLLVSLTLKTPDQDLLKNAGISSVHYPVKDFHAPTVEQLNEFSLMVEKEILKGGKVVVHCYAGKGRTGTFLAAYFVFKGSEADGAIELIRKLRPVRLRLKNRKIR